MPFDVWDWEVGVGKLPLLSFVFAVPNMYDITDPTFLLAPYIQLMLL